MTAAPPSDNAERLEYLYFNLVGQLVQVHTIDGAIIEGLFVSRTDAEGEEEPGVYLNCTRFLASQLHKPTDAANFSAESQLIHYKDIVLISAIAVKVRTEVPGSGHVTGYRGEHDLKTMDWAETVPDDPILNEELDEKSHRTGQWDQFATNAEKFGVKSTYDETKYTTQLNEAGYSKEEINRAERMAREIERSAVRGAQHRAERRDVADMAESEGELFSDVARKQPRAAAKETNKNAAAAAAPAGGSRRGAAEEVAPAAVPATAASAATSHKPDPAAAPFVPSQFIMNDYIKTLVDAIRKNPNCFSAQPDWPGEDPNGFYDRDSSAYSQQALVQQHPPQQPPMPAHLMPNQYMHHHQHHQNMSMAPGNHVNPGMMPGGFHGGMHQGYNGPMSGGYNMPQQPQPPQHMHYGESAAPHPASRPLQSQGPRSGGKPQPQQPVSSTVPQQQPQQPPPQPQQSPVPSVVPAVDAGAGEKQPPPTKKLRRGGGGGTAQRTDGSTAEPAGAGARRPGR